MAASHDAAPSTDICKDIHLSGPVLVGTVEVPDHLQSNGVAVSEGNETETGRVICETIAVGSMVVTHFGDTTVASVGEEWAAPLKPGSKILRKGRVFLLPTRSANSYFSLHISEKVPADEMQMWEDELAEIGCGFAECVWDLDLDGFTFLGLEYDATSAEEVVVPSSSSSSGSLSGSVTVGKGQAACAMVSLDSKGYFYWDKTSGNGRERTRPRWKETNCVVCRRVPNARRIIWECYHVPTRGQVPTEAKAALQLARAEADAKHQELWDGRRQNAETAASFTLQAVAAAAPFVASGVKMLLAQGTAVALEIGSDIASKAVPAAEEQLEISQETRDALAALKTASRAAASACGAVTEGIEVGAGALGREIVKRLNSGSGKDGESDEKETDPNGLAKSGEAALAGIAEVLQEYQSGKALVVRRASEATCSAVSARYGTSAGEALTDVFDAAQGVTDFRAGSSILSKTGAARVAAMHCAIGAASGPNGEKTAVVLAPVDERLQLQDAQDTTTGASSSTTTAMQPEVFVVSLEDPGSAKAADGDDDIVMVMSPEAAASAAGDMQKQRQQHQQQQDHDHPQLPSPLPPPPPPPPQQTPQPDGL
eukprot:CAMPEP_0206451194 /NCGR_PEP_ID=MMETSP0324_2-20121206/19189_1 /ASSEMBLY_ACC=CAM_ASM_000836 /TAXON_ID=2866 /ORGANISM="Crypthecodinium cohnii, Strain Seligo" /LENGTH=597 /DNA_ID=CAMNT_0053921015 /DNA_START=74 /DNA_END=1867 /DNA_ORIENTATION=+